jgi:hypothetical protein
MKLSRIFPLLVWLTQGVFSWACEDMTVRDAATLEPRDSHFLTLIARPGDERGDELDRRLSAWLVEGASGLNLELRRVDPGDTAVDWQESVGIPSPPPTSPVTVFSGRNLTENRTFFVDYWEPGPTEEDLAVLADSPTRNKIRELCPKHVGVILYSPGSDASRTESIRQTFQKVATTWKEMEALGIEVLEFDRKDPRERTLAAFFGLPPEGPDWTAVLFGRGKATPPLEGTAIEEVGLNEKLAALAAECTCLQTASSFGVDLPMVWKSQHDAAYIPMRTDIPEEETPALLAGISPRAAGPMIGAVAFLILAVILVTLMLFRRRAQAV